MKLIASLLGLSVLVASADQAGRKHAENELLARPAVRITVRDNEGWGLFVDGATHGTMIRSNVIEDIGSGRQKTGVRIGKHAGQVVLEGNTIKAANQLQDDRLKK